MSRAIKALLGIVTLWPIPYFIGLMFYLMMSFECAESASKHHGGTPLLGTEGFAMGTMLLVYALLIGYMVHLLKFSAVARDKRALWAFVLFLGNVMAMPVYWYLYVWRKPAAEAVAATPVEPIG